MAFLTQEWYEILFTVLTVFMVLLYVLVYLGAIAHSGDKYIPLIVTARTLILSGFLLWFYNPFRTKFEYGHALPTFAFAAGIALLLFLDKFQIENLVHFLLYAEVLPGPDPKKS